MSSRYDAFVKSMVETKPDAEAQKVSTAKEKFLGPPVSFHFCPPKRSFELNLFDLRKS